MQLRPALCAAVVSLALLAGRAWAGPPVTADDVPVEVPGSEPAPVVTFPPEPVVAPARPRIPELFGDAAPVGARLALPAGAIGGGGVLYVPQVRTFKITDNDSPRPQTRSYFSFNYFWNVYGPVNRHAGNGIQHIRIHRETWGWEWANKEGTASLGLRLPLNTFNAANTVPGLDGTSTDVGDLSVIFKWLLWRDAETGSLLSYGLAVTPPTGPGSFAGSDHLKVFRHTTLQPYCGWIWARGRFYLQGFTAVDAPTNLNDVALLSNSVAAGWFLYQDQGDGLLAVVPTLEVHATTPLNHRGVLRLTDPAGAADVVNLTGGLNFEYTGGRSFGMAFAVPVTGPRPFEFEILAQWRHRY